MNYRTDLAMESVDTGDGEIPEGVEVESREYGSVLMTKVRIDTGAAALRLGRPVGVYYTFEGNIAEEASEFIEPISLVLKELIPKGRVMVVGLGNPEFTPDTVGTEAASKVFATAHLEEGVFKLLGINDIRRVSVIAPNVTAKTGLPTAQIVDSIVRNVAPSAVIVVDSFAARSPDRLGNTIQISDGGIAPGSGVGGGRWEISKEVLGIPVISIGVPTVIDSGLYHDKKEVAQPMMVTPAKIDKLANKAGDIIAMALNMHLFPDLDEATIRYLVM